MMNLRNYILNWREDQPFSPDSSSTSSDLEFSTKRRRQHFTSDQYFCLENEFSENQYPCRIRRFRLSQLLNLREKQIKLWFQNRRMKMKKEGSNKLLRKMDGLKYKKVNSNLVNRLDNCSALVIKKQNLGNKTKKNTKEVSSTFNRNNTLAQHESHFITLLDNTKKAGNQYNYCDQYHAVPPLHLSNEKRMVSITTKKSDKVMTTFPTYDIFPQDESQSSTSFCSTKKLVNQFNHYSPYYAESSLQSNDKNRIVCGDPEISDKATETFPTYDVFPQVENQLSNLFFTTNESANEFNHYSQYYAKPSLQSNDKERIVCSDTEKSDQVLASFNNHYVLPQNESPLSTSFYTTNETISPCNQYGQWSEKSTLQLNKHNRSTTEDDTANQLIFFDNNCITPKTGSQHCNVEESFNQHNYYGQYHEQSSLQLNNTTYQHNNFGNQYHTELLSDLNYKTDFVTTYAENSKQAPANFCARYIYPQNESQLSASFYATYNENNNYN